MAKTRIKSDTHGLFVKHAGCVFRPVFPVGFDPKNPTIELVEGDEVTVSYKGVGASYVRIKHNDTIIYWMRHGAYIIPNGDNTKHISSEKCIIL